MPLRNLFLDFNAYFASVEQQLRPNLRGKPVAVVPVMTDSTCCIAASYEAKKFGVKTGTLVGDAKKLCPGIALIEANHRHYIEYHHKLVDAVNEILPVDEVRSIDEMVCSLVGKESLRENAIEIAKKIKRNIGEKVGGFIKCSIGIAPNQFLAKTATDMMKPDGLVVIEEKDLPHILFSLKLNDLYGIGRRMEPRLRRFGIDTVEKLCLANKSLLRKVWGGIEGERLYAQLRGEVVPRPPTHRSTVSHSHVLPPQQRNREDAYAVINRLTQKAALRMRYLRYTAGAMSVSVKFLNSERWHAQYSFSQTQDTMELLFVLNEAWKGYPEGNFKPIAVGVSLFKLAREEEETLSIFRDLEKQRKLNTAVDELNKKYGFNAAYFAGSHRALKSAPMRIAFTQIPNLELEDEDKLM